MEARRAAVIAAIVAPVSLLADLHQPLGFWQFYAYFTPWTWMFIGSIVMPFLLSTLLRWRGWSGLNH